MRLGTWITIIQFVLSLVMVCALVVGCVMPASKYPADMSGRVTIAEKLLAGIDIVGIGRESTPLDNKIFWIVDIMVKNNSYENSIIGDMRHWRIVSDDETFLVATILRVIADDIITPLNVPQGNTGKTTIVFEVPSSLKVSDAQICYQGQEPYSYGKLTGGDKVTAYDWDFKKVVTEEEKPEEHETAQEQVQREIDVVAIRVYGPPNFPAWHHIEVVVTWNEYTVPGTTYFVELISELGSLGVQSVRWDNISYQPFSITGHQTLRFENSATARFFNAIQAEQLKPISERRKFELNVVISK